MFFTRINFCRLQVDQGAMHAINYVLAYTSYQHVLCFCLSGSGQPLGDRTHCSAAGVL